MSTANTSTFFCSAASITSYFVTHLLQATIKGMPVLLPKSMQSLRYLTGRLVGTMMASKLAPFRDRGENLSSPSCDVLCSGVQCGVNSSFNSPANESQSHQTLYARVRGLPVGAVRPHLHSSREPAPCGQPTQLYSLSVRPTLPLVELNLAGMLQDRS